MNAPFLRRGAIRSAMVAMLGASLWVAAVAQQASARIPVPEKREEGYRIGPYPVEIEQDGAKGTFYSWLYFIPIVEGRGETSYRLRLVLKVQLTALADMFKKVMDDKYPHDNCGRINNIDNWVYTTERPSMAVVDAHRLRVDASVMVSTWSCFENPAFETVCDSYRDSLGIEWPYNCKTRRASPIKMQLLRQGVDVTKEFWLDAADGALQYKDNEPTIKFAGGPIDTISNFAVTIFHNVGAAYRNAAMTPSRIEMMVPEDYRAFHPTYDLAGFETAGGEPFIVVGASAGVTAQQINAFMRRTFGGLWTDIVPTPTSAPTAMTKTELARQCAESMAGEDIRTCAAKMGYPYDELPD